MKSAALLLLALIAGASTSTARIGDTRDELKARLGPPVHQGVSGEIVYFKNGFLVVAFFYKGKCASIGYSKQKSVDADPAPLTTEEKKLLMNNNSAATWRQVKDDAWETDALRADYSQSGFLLNIATLEFLEAGRKKSKSSIEGL